MQAFAAWNCRIVDQTCPIAAPSGRCRGRGGGNLIEFPDLPGGISDGATSEDAITNGPDAMRGRTPAMRAKGHPIPAPTRAAAA